jgi:ATP-dependent helicase/nuclease subunit B
VSLSPGSRKSSSVTSVVGRPFSMPPRVFTIPSSVPFLPALIGAMRDGRVVDGFAPTHASLGFANATIFLPTRRACRLARDAFLAALDVDAALLPRIVAIGDIDEDEFAFADAATGAGASDALALPPALDALERRFLLARLVRKWADRMELVTGKPLLVVRHPSAVLALADDLARLMDDMTTREVPWQRLDRLVPDSLDVHWQRSLDFLKIAFESWPAILDERGAIEPAARRDRLIALETSRLAAASGAPVIAAGSTGSMPSTAKLLATIASLPHGAVVLPGLDTELDEEGWNAIGGDARAPDAPLSPADAAAAGHPQFAMHALLARIGIARRDVGILLPPASHGREILASEALRPAASTDQWRTRLAEQRRADAIAHGLESITVIAAGNAEEEALAIAVALREALIEPKRIAALVTPDRALARRVAVMLQRWNVAAEDSGGDKLADTPAGVFARLAAEAAFGGLAPATLLALLKHKLARLGVEETRHRHAVAALECAVLRGPRPRPGSAGLAGALATVRREIAKLRRGESSEVHFSDPRAALSDAQLAEAEALVGRIASALAPLEGLAGTRHFAELAGCHREVIAALGADAAGAVGAFSGADGEGLAAAFDDIAGKVGAEPFDAATEDYVELFRLAIEERVVRRSGAPGSRIRIYGPLEARLVGIDRVVIGGLVEGVWPPDPRTDAWLSRPMRQQLGLDLPERRIGLSAHDFAQLLGAREVFLTHAVKLNGAPTVSSRFLQRLAAVAGERAWGEAAARGERYRALARSLDAPRAPPRPVGRPEPRPPVGARPQSLSVTEIEHWLRDPYTIYAKHILKLPRLDPIDQRPGAAERGSIIHGAVGDFAKAFAEALPADPVAELLRFGALRFAPLGDFPEARAFWWPRFERIACWFADYEKTRRAGMAAAHAEIRGELTIATSGGFRLTGRADRIERRADGRYAVLDFKTGAPPSGPQVLMGLAPQLTLEAAMLRRGGFPGIAAGGTLAELVYVRLNGGDPPGLERPVDLDGRSPDAVADEALAKLTALVRRFEDERTPYRSLILSMWTNRYGTYDDLARVKEWSLAGGAEEPDMPGVQP